MAGNYLPSEVARLVLGYLKELKCPKSYNSFVEECPYLAEYREGLKRGKEYPTNINDQSLLSLLEQAQCDCKTKGSSASESHQPSTSNAPLAIPPPVPEEWKKSVQNAEAKIEQLNQQISNLMLVLTSLMTPEASSPTPHTELSSQLGEESQTQQMMSSHQYSLEPSSMNLASSSHISNGERSSKQDHHQHPIQHNQHQENLSSSFDNLVSEIFTNKELILGMETPLKDMEGSRNGCDPNHSATSSTNDSLNTPKIPATPMTPRQTALSSPYRRGASSVAKNLLMAFNTPRKSGASSAMVMSSPIFKPTSSYSTTTTTVQLVTSNSPIRNMHSVNTVSSNHHHVQQHHPPQQSTTTKSRAKPKKATQPKEKEKILVSNEQMMEAYRNLSAQNKGPIVKTNKRRKPEFEFMYPSDKRTAYNPVPILPKPQLQGQSSKNSSRSPNKRASSESRNQNSQRLSEDNLDRTLTEDGRSLNKGSEANNSNILNCSTASDLQQSPPSSTTEDVVRLTSTPPSDVLRSAPNILKQMDVDDFLKKLHNKDK